MRRSGVLGIPVGIAALVGVALLGIAPTGTTSDFLIGAEGLQRVVVYGVPAGLIVYGTMQLNVRENVWTYLGDASYSLYLTHTFAVTGLLALWITFPVPADLIVIIGMIASVVLAWRVHELIEKPLLRALPPDMPRWFAPHAKPGASRGFTE